MKDHITTISALLVLSLYAAALGEGLFLLDALNHYILKFW